MLRPAFPFMEYLFDYEYISTVLCENKEKPELQCNGKCYLMKELAKASQQESDQKKKGNSTKIELQPFVLIQDDFKTLLDFSTTTRKPLPIAIDFYSSTLTTALLRPPIV